MREQKQSIEILKKYPETGSMEMDLQLREEVNKNNRKIIVLDDDPTGVQTVHDVSVYTDWSLDSIRQGFKEDNMLFFILTNSRGFTIDQTTKAHEEIAQNIHEISKELQIPFLIISRSDSTLRGHYPLETELLRAQMKELEGQDIDGEILCPYFKEGGRFTIDNVHYVRYGQELVPAGETEFALDETFGYHSSNLCEYVEEKTKGMYKKEDCICISLDLLRSMNLEKIEEAILQASNFQKIIVNAVCDMDVRIFSISLYRAMGKNHSFIIRSAAALVKEMGNITSIPLLSKEQMVTKGNENGGIIVVGSHTKKTTDQLEILKQLRNIEFIEMNSDLVLQSGELEKEVVRIIKQEEEIVKSGKTVCVSTKRALLKVENDTPQDALVRSVAISNALQQCVGKLSAVPSFVIAKGGITSSDVGTKALGVKKAYVLGQIQPGIPVWRIGKESLFPGTPYVIFPGNVGEIDTLKKAAEIFLA